MKKYIYKLLVPVFALISVICFTFGLTSCNNAGKSHKHTYGSWAITAPTNEVTGKAVKTCTACKVGQAGHYVEVVLPVLGDERYEITDDTATCTESGTKVYSIIINNEYILFNVETPEKGHSFDESFWMSDDEGHWYLPTCGHDDQKGNLSEHDYDSNYKCKDCDYQHTHSFAETWERDESTHWLPATCNHGLKDKEAAHVDENEDELCDVCGYGLTHSHNYSEEWSVDENNHWHEPTCTDTTVPADKAAHSYTNGVCECGVKQTEAMAYAILKAKTGLRDSFTAWLNSVKANGVINITTPESGDVVYSYGDGTEEAVYVAERLVRVKALSSGEGVAHFWIMVSLYEDGDYREIKGSYALGLAETDMNGVAVITFMPVRGYTSNSVDYRVRIAERKDIAAYFSITEDRAPKAIPDRYVASSNSDAYISVDVNGNAVSDNILGQFTFNYSKGWDAYEKFTLPYARYYEKPYEGENLIETGTTYEFTASGGNLFDYFFFTPSRRYSFASADSTFTPEQLAVIVENFQKAASGIYKIYFKVEGSANVTLYYWNESGVNLGAYHVTKADGTPSDEYITSISGGTAGKGKYTGGNFVNVTVTQANGLREYQFGIISDSAVKITFTVERIGDYVIDTNGSITVGDNNNITLLGNGEATALQLRNVPVGYYYLTITTNESGARQSGMFSAYVDPKLATPLWDGSQIKGMINIPEGTEFIYIVNYYVADVLKVSVNLTAYKPPVVKEGEEITVPISGNKDIKYEILLDESVTSGMCKLELTLSGGNLLSGALYHVLVIVGDNEYPISLPISTNYAELVTEYISVNQGDTLSVYILVNGSDNPYHTSVVNGKLKMTALSTIKQGVEVSVEFTDTFNTRKDCIFVADKEGTYKLTITQTNYPIYNNDIFGYMDLTVLKIIDLLTGEIIREADAFGPLDKGSLITEITLTFNLKELEILAFQLRNLGNTVGMSIEFKIEFVEN